MKPNDWLCRIMKAHGVHSELHEEWVVFPDHDKRGYARLFPRKRLYQLDVGIEIFPGWTVLESFAGIGEDEDTALKDAFDAFMRGTLHVILTAFFGSPQDEQIHCEEWEIAETPRQVTLGNAICRGTPPADIVAQFSQLEAVLKSSLLPKGAHWVRIYYAQINNQTVSCEALLDNEPWPELQEALMHFAWPAAAEFYSIRLFLCIQGGVGLGEACTAICHKGNSDAISEMVSLGATLREATLLYSFVTLAFGRELIKQLGVTTSDRFVLQHSDGQQVKHPLVTDPLYKQAAVLAQSRNQLSKEQFGCIAMQSPEVVAVNKSLNNGARATDLTLAEPLIYLPERGAAFSP